MTRLTIQQICAKIGVDRSTVYRMIQHRKLPPAVERRNRTALWAADAVEAAMKKHQIRAVVR